MAAASFRDRKCGFRCPAGSQTVQQLFCLLFVLGASFAVLFIVMNSTDQYVCDYTDIVDTCDEQPFYRTDMERNNSLVNFNLFWFMKAQELRNETEELKCKAEKQLMEELTAYHRMEAQKIVQKCHAAFQKCVDDMRTQNSWTTTTTSSTITTTQYTYAQATTRDVRGECQKLADKSDLPMATFTACITDPSMLDNLPPEAGTTTPPPPFDCTMCDSFCRAFNWTQLNPEYATLMNFSGACTSKMCPWIPECGDGMNIHRNCSARGCPCQRAKCTSTTTTTIFALGGRLLQDDATTTNTPPPPRYVQYTTTTTYENLENNTNCTCKPGPVDIVMVGRPFKVFYGDPLSQLRRRRSWRGGRRLEEADFRVGPYDPEFDEELAKEEIRLDKEKRYLQALHLYDNLNSPVEHMQGVHVEMEEEILIERFREFNCRNYFSDKYKYVFPRTVGGPETREAVLARYAHPDLGCGYEGDFKITCGPEILRDNETGEVYDTGNCSYKVDISTCRPPNYNKALDSCYQEDSWTAGEELMPEIKDFLDVEVLNLTVGDPVESHDIPSFAEEQCCEIHVGSECVKDFNYTGMTTDDGVWSPEMSYNRETGYFPRVACNEQGTLRHRSCPRVRINKISRAADTDLLKPCRVACNLTYARQELDALCVDPYDPKPTSGPSVGTYERELAAFRKKVDLMQQKRDELEQWARGTWPLVGKTQKVLDCIADMSSSRYNSLGHPGDHGGFDQLRQRYECRLHGCTNQQCVKVTRLCPIPQMESAPEAQCGPFGDQNMYECVDKVAVTTWGMASRPVGWGWLALSIMCFMAAFATWFEENCMKKKSRVVPYRDAINDEEEESRHCDKCGELIDSDAFDEGSPTCTKCIMKAQMPETCRNCGREFEDPEDEFCTHCRQPRAMSALTDGGEQVCMRCGEPMDLQDAKCLQCGWKVEDAIVLKADTAPLRASAQAAANERRMVPPNVHFQGVHGLE